MSRPANRTALRAEENRPGAAQPAGQRQRGNGPDPVQFRAGRTRAPFMCRAVSSSWRRIAWSWSSRQVIMASATVTCCCPAADRCAAAAARTASRPAAVRDDLAQGRRALVEEDRVDPLHPGGVLAAQVMVGLQQRPGFQDLPGRDPALGQPALGQQLPQVPGVGLVGLGVPLAAAGERGVGRLGQVRAQPGRGHLLGDVPPPGAPLERERDIAAPGEPGQPRPQVLPVRGRDLPARHLPRHGVEVVEGQLLPVNIEPAYDGHRDLLKLPRAPRAPERE